MAELRPIIVFHGHHFVCYIVICNSICVNLLHVMSGIIPRKLNKKRRLYLKPFPGVRKCGIHTHDDSMRRNAMRCISPNDESKQVFNRFYQFCVKLKGIQMHIQKVCNTLKKSQGDVFGNV